MPEILALSPAELAIELFRPITLARVFIGEGALSCFSGTWQGRQVRACLFDAARDHGSIGRDEADQLVRVLRCAGGADRLILVMNTSGIRVTDSTHGIASLRRALREAEDARLRGVPMLAVVIKQVFGGASILASLCERRIMHANGLYAMSGPRLIEQATGAAGFDSRNRDAVEALIGGAARAKMSSDFVLAEPAPAAFREAILAWLAQTSSAPVNAARLKDSGEALRARLGAPLADMAASYAAALPEAESRLLARFAPAERFDRIGGYGVVRALREDGSNESPLFVFAPEGLSYAGALTLASELLRLSDVGARDLAVFVDTPGHALQAQDEHGILSDAMAYLALVVRWVAVNRGLHVRVIGAGGGGVQGALGSGATSVSMLADARLYVLPKSAMQALNKSEDEGAGSLTQSVAAGAVDAEFVAHVSA